jgi:predicted TIM-barrel fold metal-dependent hydrolase
MRIIDTHLHLVYLDKFRYPWLDDAGPLNRQWDFPLYWSEASKLGIESAIHMEVDVLPRQAEDEARFVLALDPHVTAAIMAGHPESMDFPAHLERIADEPRIKGIRRLLQGDPDDLSAGDVFRDNIRRLRDHKLAFDICIRPDQLGIARNLAAACPDVQFVLDHCGNPPIPGGDLAQRGADLEAWRAGIAALAELPNVAGKISGIVNHAPAGWTAETLRPAVEHIIKSFGWDRVVFGSDRPVLTLNGTLTQWVEALKQIVAGASQDEQSKLFSKNAERIYRLA